MQFIDLKTQYKRIETQVKENIYKVLEHGNYIMGSEVNELEKRLSDYVGVKHCISCSNGTDALLMPLMAWDIGVGDAVFTTPFTFIATAEVISLLGATPVFVDIEKDTFNMSFDSLECEIIKTIKEGKLKPRAIIPVDLFGLPADYTNIVNIATKYELKVLEDGAQGFGGEYQGKKACSFGHAATTSFFPAKPLGCYGDGGAVFTNDDELAVLLKSIRVHGKGSHKYENVRIGINARLDTLQAAILHAKLDIFEDEIKRRNEIAELYTEQLKGILQTPYIPDNCTSVWAQYSVLTKNKEEKDIIQEKLRKKNIPTAIYYPIPLHLQDAFKNCGYKKGDFPISEKTSNVIFSLPMHPYMHNDEIVKICNIIKA